VRNDKTVIALGFFDGVHIGHGALLKKTAELAKELGCKSAAFTFATAPKEFVSGIPLPLLSAGEEREALIKSEYGIDEVYFEPFDRAMMTMPWQEFIDSLLVGKYHAVHLVAGHDYRFGFKNEGNPELLQSYCAAHGIGCDIIPKVERDGITVSSTYIRTLVENGEMERAAEFLGHPYTLTGKVVHGKGIGTKSLFPTANLLPSEKKILPPKGVYASCVRLPDGREFAAVTNIGTRPTVSSDGSVTVETTLMDFSGDLYGHKITVLLGGFLREEQKFSSTQELHAQIECDIAAAITFINNRTKR